MNISGKFGINYKAQFLTNVTVQKYDNKSKEYSDKHASFVEVDPKDKNDLRSVRHAVENWNMDLYGMNISNSMNSLRWSTDKKLSDKFFAITTQDNNFEELNPDKIKALAHVFETNKRVDVVHLQVNPDLIYAITPPDYKHVGKGMIDCLKDKYNDKSISLISSPTATQFYVKQGFEKITDAENRLVWNKEAEENCEYKNEYW